MNVSKIVLPSAVAEAIRYYTDLADTKSEAFTDILSMGFEGERSEIILRHFDGNHDELMEALICGYEVEKSPEEQVREYYETHCRFKTLTPHQAGIAVGICATLKRLGITIEGVNAQ
jgi:hypothetical protein